MVITGGRFDFERYGLSNIDANVRSEALDIAITGVIDIPTRISRERILTSDRIAAGLSLSELREWQYSKKSHPYQTREKRMYVSPTHG
jgi:hypothetical protein